MALWVSFSDWNGRGSPFSSNVGFVGLENYADVTTGGGLTERNFGLSLRNNAWYVVLVVPLQTALSLFLAVLVSRAILRGRGFFRTAFYFPSVTSSVAITILWLFLFSKFGRRERGAVLGRHQRSELVPGTTRNHPSRHGQGTARRPPLAADEPVPRCHLVGVDRRAIRRDERLHPDGDLHDQRHLHAPLRRSPAEHRRRTRRSGHDGRRQRLAALLAHHAPPAAADDLHRADPGSDRLLAGVRPDLHRHEGRAGEDDADAGLPVVPGGVREPELGTGCRDRLHPVPDHHRVHDLPALGAPRAAGLEAPDPPVPGEGPAAGRAGSPPPS